VQVPGLGFLAPTTTPATSPSDPSPSSEGPSLEPPAAASAPAWSDLPHDDELPEAAPRRRKSGASPASSLASKAALEAAARRVVLVVTEAAHAGLTAGDPLAQDAEVWIADEQDLDGIATPAAAIASRRSPEVGNDLVDGIALAIAVAGYVVKQFSKLRTIRAARRAGLDAHLPDTEGQPS
jgi:hypothetical protein